MLSIVVPLYNKELFINRCIDSVLAQNYSDFELIIINDGSTDNSPSIAQSYDDKRIKVITQNNLGTGEARNRGVKESSAEWIAFLDADDVWASNHLAELRKVIEEFYDAGIVSTRSTEISNLLQLTLYSDDRKWKRYQVDYFKQAGSIKGLLNSSCVAIRRTVFDRVGYFKDFKQGQDTEFWVRVCLVYPCAVSEKPTSFYCRGTGGVTEQNFEKNIANSISIKSIRDMEPAIHYLVDEIVSGNVTKEMQVSVVTFINARIVMKLKQLLYNGQIDMIPIVGDFFMQPLSFKNSVYRSLSKRSYLELLSLYKIRSLIRMLYRFIVKNIK